MIRKIIAGLSIITLFVTNLNAQSDKYPIINYSKNDYGKGQEATSWSVVQDNSGFIYFGNANAVLEFDGTNWNVIQIKRGVWVTSLAVDKKGTMSRAPNVVHNSPERSAA